MLVSHSEISAPGLLNELLFDNGLTEVAFYQCITAKMSSESWFTALVYACYYERAPNEFASQKDGRFS